MKLPEVTFDDRSFQSLVDESRRRIADSCPEWTEHNVSDPGITLIELFAWMTEVLLYRVNQLPVRLQLAMLDLLGTTPEPPQPASAALRFELAGGQPLPVRIPAGTEVATAEEPDHPAVVYTTIRDTTIPARTLSSMVLQRGGVFTSVTVVEGVARPVGADRPVFSPRPRDGDSLYLGFRQPLAELVLEVAVQTIEARGVAIDPDLAPLVWQVSQRDGTWAPATMVRDTTGGLNFTTGVVRLQIPLGAAVATVAGEAMFWVRCRLTDPGDAPPTGYLTPPKIVELSAAPCGAVVEAEHSHRVTEELLGYSDGIPGQRFALHQSPALAFERDAEGVEVKDPDTKEFVLWTRCDTLADSGALDQHYRFDIASGEIEFGPAVRESAGWRQHGAVPPAGAAIRMRAYRYGGGHEGNLEAHALTHLRTGVPGVATVTNPLPTAGGVGIASIEALRATAALEYRTRRRAVTAGDFETLVAGLPRVARCRCLPPEGQGGARVYVLPTIAPKQAARPTPQQATASTALIDEVQALLEGCMVIGTSAHVTAVPLKGVIAAIEVDVASAHDIEPVQAEVLEVVTDFLNPYTGDIDGAGWAWGRSLHAGELSPLIRAVRGVTGIAFARLYEADPRTGTPRPGPAMDRLKLAPAELLISGLHLVHAVAR
ncbi:MAG: putative baseplate assembly protein [Conexibacter sp.]|nr:putative baseplate assembly protein [Solirubrobacterales bacterium]MCW3004793.1 putative baseplate assembly protein [Conexibacter sp.]